VWTWFPNHLKLDQLYLQLFIAALWYCGHERVPVSGERRVAAGASTTSCAPRGASAGDAIDIRLTGSFYARRA
jgi:hypothetical protein